MKIFVMDENFDWEDFDPNEALPVGDCPHGAKEESCGACLHDKLASLLGG